MRRDVETKVKQANLLTADHQLEQLFGPDMTDRLLDDIRAKKEGRMPGIQNTQQSTTEAVSSGQTAVRTRPRSTLKLGLVFAGVAAVLIITIGLLNVGRATVAAPPKDVDITTTCPPYTGPRPPVNGTVHECTLTATDVRLEGDWLQDLRLDAEFPERYYGNVTITNGDGTWAGEYTAVRDGFHTTLEGLAVGQGDYQGLVYEWEGKGWTESGGRPYEISGVIKSSAEQVIPTAASG